MCLYKAVGFKRQGLALRWTVFQLAILSVDLYLATYVEMYQDTSHNKTFVCEQSTSFPITMGFVTTKAAFWTRPCDNYKGYLCTAFQRHLLGRLKKVPLECHTANPACSAKQACPNKQHVYFDQWCPSTMFHDIASLISVFLPSVHYKDAPFT